MGLVTLESRGLTLRSTTQDRFLILPKMQPVKIKLHRMIPEGWKLKSVTVSREPFGKYFASLLFDCENQTAEKRQAENREQRKLSRCTHFRGPLPGSGPMKYTKKDKAELKEL